MARGWWAAAAVAAAAAVLGWMSCGRIGDEPSRTTKEATVPPAHRDGDASPAGGKAKRPRAELPDASSGPAARSVVRGTVTEAEKRTPIVAATVRAFFREKTGDRGPFGVLDAPPSSADDETRTGADGAFEIRAGATASLLLVASAPGFRSSSVYAKPGDDVPIQLTRAGDHEYSVIDEEDRPIARADLTLYAESLAGPPVAWARTGEDGRARLAAAGRDALLVVADGYETTTESWAANLKNPIVLRRGSEIAGVGSSRVDLQACKLEYSIVSPK